ncbi:SRPBCC family protein [Spirillospora sp. CA-108201]
MDEFLPHPPAKVWRALTEPDLLARWLMPNDFKAVVGHRFTFTAKPIPVAGFDGTIACGVLDVEEARLLRISRRGGGLDTTVTWRLVPEGRCRSRVRRRAPGAGRRRTGCGRGRRSGRPRRGVPRGCRVR